MSPYKNYILLTCLWLGLPALAASTNQLAKLSFESGETWEWEANPPTYLEGGIFGPVTNLSTMVPKEGRHFFGLSNLAKGEDGKAFWHYLTVAPASLKGASNAWLEFSYFSLGFDKEDYFQYALLLDGSNLFRSYASLEKDTSGSWKRISLALPPLAEAAGLSFKIKQSGAQDYAGLDCIGLFCDDSQRRPKAPGLSVLTQDWSGVSLQIDCEKEEILLARGESQSAFLTNRPKADYALKPGDKLGQALVIESAPGLCQDTAVTPGRTYCYKAWQKEADGEYSAGSQICSVTVPELPKPVLRRPSFENGTLDDETALVLRPDLDPRLEIRLTLASSTNFVSAPLPFFSEYGKGAKENRYLEIYNPGTNTCDLGSFLIGIFENGSEVATQSLSLAGQLKPDGTFLVACNKADAYLTNLADLVSAKICMTGNDAVGLFIGSELVDVIGKIGECPKTAWEVSGVAIGTANHTLVRRKEIGQGTLDWEKGKKQWEVKGKDDWGDLKYHLCTAPKAGTLVSPYIDCPMPEEGLLITNLVQAQYYYVQARCAYNGHHGAMGPLCGPFSLIPEPFLSLHLLAAVALLLRPHLPSKIPGGHGFSV